MQKLIFTTFLLFGSFSISSQSYNSFTRTDIERKFREIIYADGSNLYKELFDLYKLINTKDIESPIANGLVLILAEMDSNYDQKKSYDILYNYLYATNRKFINFKWEKDFEGKKIRFVKIEGWTKPEVFGVKSMEDMGIKLDGDVEDSHLKVDFETFSPHYLNLLKQYGEDERLIYDGNTNNLLKKESYALKFLDFFLEYDYSYSGDDFDGYENSIKNHWNNLILEGSKIVADSKFKGISSYYNKLFLIAEYELKNAKIQYPLDEEIDNFLIATRNEKLLEEKGEFTYKYINFPLGWTKTKSQYFPNWETTTNLFFDLNQDGFLDEIIFLFPVKSNTKFKFHSLFIFLNDGKGSLKYSQRIDINGCKYDEYHKNQIMFGSLFDKYTKPSGGPIVALTFIPGKEEFYRYIPNLLKWDKALNKVVTQGIEPWINFY